MPMEPSIFEDIFKDSHLPVIVCEDDDHLTVVFANRIATLMTRPSFTVDRLAGLSDRLPLREFMAFHLPDEDQVISRALRDSGSIARYATAVLAPDGTQIRMVLSAHLATVSGRGYALIHFTQDAHSEDFELQTKCSFPCSIFPIMPRTSPPRYSRSSP